MTVTITRTRRPLPAVGEQVAVAAYRRSILGTFAGPDSTPTYGGGHMVYVNGDDGTRYWCADAQLIRRTAGQTYTRSNDALVSVTR